MSDQVCKNEVIFLGLNVGRTLKSQNRTRRVM